MQLYDTEIRDDVLYLETDDGEIGSMADICELVGGDTYTLQYDDRQRHVDWLDTDEEGTLTFDGRDVLAEMSYDREFVATVASVAIDRTDDEGYPLRTSVFADLMTRTWDAKGRTRRATSGPEIRAATGADAGGETAKSSHTIPNSRPAVAFGAILDGRISSGTTENGDRRSVYLG